jgi:putative flavoprotein involved in K+ transport
MWRLSPRFYGRAMTTQRIPLVPPADGIESIPTVIIGGGQAGLVIGYHLQRLGERFLILDAQPRIGDTWRHRWDSLRLHTPPRYSNLPGWPIQVSSFATHTEMADYLEAYAHHFKLPVRTGVTVNRLSRSDGGFRLETSQGELRASRVVIATGGYQTPAVPDFAAELTPEISQLHSSAYRNPSQLTGTVLVVGAGNSGAEIALEAVQSGHRTWLAGRHPGQLPFRIETPVGRVLVRVVMFAFRRVLTLDTPMGRKLHAATMHHGKPLVRTKIADLEAAGVQRVGPITGIRNGLPVTEDDQVLDPQTVVWCTGFRPDYSWIDLPVAIEDGHLSGVRGVSPEAGLFYIGQEFQYSAASSIIQGLDQDARHLMRAMAEQPSAVNLPAREPTAA